MEFLQIVIGGMFSMLGAGSIFYLAFRAHLLGAEVAELKEILKDIRRNTAGVSSAGPAAVGRLSHAVSEPQVREPGDWPSVTDPSYNAELPYALRPAAEPEPAPAPKRLWS